jgi:hypothetical protein
MCFFFIPNIGIYSGCLMITFFFASLRYNRTLYSIISVKRRWNSRFIHFVIIIMFWIIYYMDSLRSWAWDFLFCWHKVSSFLKWSLIFLAKWLKQVAWLSCFVNACPCSIHSSFSQILFIHTQMYNSYYKANLLIYSMFEHDLFILHLLWNNLQTKNWIYNNNGFQTKHLIWNQMYGGRHAPKGLP